MADKSPPHARLTVEDIKLQFKYQFLTTTGYIYNYIITARKEGWRIRTTALAFCQELNISRSAFYRAITKLKYQGVIDFEVHGDIEIWATEKLIYLSQERENLSQKWDEKSRKWDTKSHKRDEKSQEWENESWEPASDNGSGDSSDLIQISYRSNTTLSQFPAEPPADERGIFENDQENQEAIQTSDIQPDQSNLKKAEDFKEVKILNSDQNLDQSSAAIKKDSKNDLLAFIERSAPDYVKSPRAWARKCLETDEDYWQDSFQIDQTRRSLNAQIRHQHENAAAYEVHQTSSATMPIRTIADERSKLHAKWMMGKLDPKFRQEAIAASTKLGFIVSETGIHLPGGADPTQSLTSWLEA